MQELHFQPRRGVLQRQGDVTGLEAGDAHVLVHHRPRDHHVLVELETQQGEEADGGGRIGHGHGDVVEVLQHPVILAASRPMHDLKLEPVGIGEEHRMLPPERKRPLWRCRRMQIQVVCCHPLPDSYDHALFRTIIDTLEQNGHGVVATDLYREGFAPAMTAPERRTYMGNDYDASAVARYVDILKQVDGLILCFPHWWFSMPAMLKGWVDRVWGPGTAFVYDPKDGHLRPSVPVQHQIVRRGDELRLAVVDRARVRGGRRPQGADARHETVVREDVQSFYLAHYRMDASTPASREAFLKKVRTGSPGSEGHKVGQLRQPSRRAGVRTPREAVMWRKCLISLGLLTIVLTACDPQLLIAKPDPRDDEVVALIAQ